MSRRSVQMRKVANSGPIIAIRTDNGGTAYVRSRKGADEFAVCLPSASVYSTGRKKQWYRDTSGALKSIPGAATGGIGTRAMLPEKRARIMTTHYPKAAG